MQDFIEKVSESKGKLLVGLGGVAVVGLFGYLYRQYQNQTSQEKVVQQVSQPTEPFNLRNELTKFKSTLNLANPTLEQMKRVINFVFDMSYKEIQILGADFKKSRRAIKEQGNFKDYFKVVGLGVIRLKQMETSLQQSLLIDMGVTPETLAIYQSQLVELMNEKQRIRDLGNLKITLDQIKTAINNQANFLKEHGDQLVSNIINYCQGWQIQAKKFIPDVFSIYLADQLAIRHPQIDNYDMRTAQKRFERYLPTEIAMVKQQVQPLVFRLIKELGIYESTSSNDMQETQNQ